jgi:hypothetical protein
MQSSKAGSLYLQHLSEFPSALGIATAEKSTKRKRKHYIDKSKLDLGKNFDNSRVAASFMREDTAGS